MNETTYQITTYNWNKKRTYGTPQVISETANYDTARAALLEAYGNGFKDVQIKADYAICVHIWFICLDCRAKDGEGVAFYVQEKPCGASGYAVTPEGERLCFSCSAKREFAYVAANEKWTGYLVNRDGNYFVTDWTGNVTFPVVPNSMSVTKYPTNKPHKRAIEPYKVTTAKFTDHKGRMWQGKNDERRGDLFDAKLIKAR